MFVEYCMCAFALFSPVVSFSHGAPDFSCKDPSTFHTRKINATHEGIIMPGDALINPYSLILEGNTYRPGEKIAVTIQSSDASRPIRGFFIQAVQAGIHLRDLRRRPYGSFENRTADERPSVCQSFRSKTTTGITHSNNKGKQNVTVTWVAPVEYNPGDIQFLATGVLDYATYWTNLRSQTLVPEGYTLTSENTVSRSHTPTAAWFRWLQYLRQQQLLKENLGLPLSTAKDNKWAGHDHMEAGHDHHHHHHHSHDHAHDHSHMPKVNTETSTQTSSETSTQTSSVVPGATTEKQKV